MTNRQRDTACLVMVCPDRPGLVAAASSYLHGHGANILQLDQYTSTSDSRRSKFFLRVIFEMPELRTQLTGLIRQFGSTIAGEFQAQFAITNMQVPKRAAIFVSRFDHCLYDLLWRWERGEIPVDIGLIVSNHPEPGKAAKEFGIRFEHVPVTAKTKGEAEARQLELLRGQFDLVVLARYMQVLSGHFLDSVGMPVINIHHSALPAFTGAGPYERAKARGVKMIGATAHYVTRELDEGPIIAQDVTAVTHRETLEDLVEAGSHVERSVLAAAVKAHCEDRVLLDGDTTVVF